MNLISWVIFIYFIATNSVLGDNKCSPREYGKGYIVCVCSEKYCDSFESPPITNGVVTIVESNKDGKRFQNRFELFNKASQLEKHDSSESFIDIKINRKQRYQKIIGFGGTFTDSATFNIRSLPDSLSKRLIKDYFSKDGLEYSIARLPIGGNDFSMRGYTYDDGTEDFNLTRFRLQAEDVLLKIPVIKQAMAVAAEEIHLYGTAWSSPAWMKTTDQIIGPGFLKGSPGGKYYKTWADYYVKFLNAYKSFGINLWGMTTGNLPYSSQGAGFPLNALCFKPNEQRDFVKLDLGPALKRAGYAADNFNVMIHDDVVPYLPLSADAVFGDKEANKYVTGAGIHWDENYLKNVYSILDLVHEKYPNRFFIGTEASTGSSFAKHRVSLGNWTQGVRYAKDIINDLNHYTSGWTDWNLALDDQGGPTWINFFVDAPIIVNKTASEYYKNPMFYVMGHFSKFLKRNSVRIGFEETKSHLNDAMATVFETPANETVIVVLNPSDRNTKLSVSDPEKGVFKISLSSNSINTLIWN